MLGLEQIRSKVMLPEWFDQRVEGLTPEIGGFTTVSLEHLLRGVRNSQWVVAPYHPDGEDLVLFCDIAKEVMRNLYNPRWKRSFTYRNPLAQLVQDNRSHGKRWGVVGVAERYLGQPVISDGFLHDFYRGAIDDQLVEWVDGDPGKKVDAGFMDWLYRCLPSVGDRLRFQQEAQKFKGVQLVYGDQQEFTSWLGKQHCSPEDDIAVSVPCPIPGRLVRYVIPLGAGEQEYFDELAWLDHLPADASVRQWS